MARHQCEPSPPISFGAPCPAAAGKCRWKHWQAPLGMDDGRARTERTNERKIGGETPTDARLFCRGIGHGRASQRGGAHLSAFHRGSRPKESFIARDSASGQASWDAADSNLPFERHYPPRPVPVQRQHLALRSLVSRFRSSHSFAAPSHANLGIKRTLASITWSCGFGFEVPLPVCGLVGGTSNPPHECAGELMPKTARARVASPPAGTALTRAIRDCLPGRVRQGRDSILYVTLSVTYVNVTVTNNFRGL